MNVIKKHVLVAANQKTTLISLSEVVWLLIYIFLELCQSRQQVGDIKKRLSRNIPHDSFDQYKLHAHIYVVMLLAKLLSEIFSINYYFVAFF